MIGPFYQIMTKATIDELTVLATLIYEEIRELSKEEQKRISKDRIMGSSIQGYMRGFRRYDWDDDIEAELDEIEDILFLEMDRETFENRIDNHIDDGTWDEESIKRIVETEYHRCEEAGAYDYANKFSKKWGIPIKKKWETMLDMKVRDTHDYLQSMEVDLNDDFYTYDNDHAPYPGMFTTAENNINCRCWIEYVRQGKRITSIAKLKR